jgi:hypothetical protein
VAIPFGQSAFDIAMKLRRLLIVDRNLIEGTFTIYGNINRLPPQHQSGLHLANVKTQHTAYIKGGADQQIQIDLQHFKEPHHKPATIVLISGDIDFIKHINDLRFRHRHYIIVIHNQQVKRELLKTANEAFPLHDFTEPRCLEPNITSSVKERNVSMATNDDGGPQTTAPPKKKPVRKKLNKAAETGNFFSCSKCDRKYSTDAIRAQHEKDMHKVVIVENLISLTSIEDSNSHHVADRTPSENEEKLENLIDIDDDDSLSKLIMKNMSFL